MEKVVKIVLVVFSKFVQFVVSFLHLHPIISTFV